MKKRLEQTHIVVGFEGRAITAADHDAAHIFAAAAGGGMSSRLFQEVREKRGLAYGVSAGLIWFRSAAVMLGGTRAAMVEAEAMIAAMKAGE